MRYALLQDIKEIPPVAEAKGRENRRNHLRAASGYATLANDKSPIFGVIQCGR